MTHSSAHIQTVRRYKRDVYGEYGGYYYVPMSEAYTVQVPVTVSCSYRKCLYCDLNQGMTFRELSLDEITENVRKLRYINSSSQKNATKFLLAGGNPFVLNTAKLLRISEIIHTYFPECEYISCFSRADDVTRKTPAELQALKASGYDRLCLGLESGSDQVLAYHRKGVTVAQNLQAVKMLDDSGIKYSAYIMLGLGGRDWSDSHVDGTVEMLNQSAPLELIVVTTVLFKGAELAERVRKHEFRRLPPVGALKEGREILSRLEISTVWNATHKTNLFPVKGRIPEHKGLLLKRIDDELRAIESVDLKQYELKRWRKWGIE